MCTAYFPHTLCVPLTHNFFAKMCVYAIPNLFWALTDNKSRESNALQTKYINKFCLCSAVFFRLHSFLSLRSSSSFCRIHIRNALPTTTKNTFDSWSVLIHSKYIVYTHICIAPTYWYVSCFFFTHVSNYRVLCHKTLFVFACRMNFGNIEQATKCTPKYSFSFLFEREIAFQMIWMWKCHNFWFKLTQTHKHNKYIIQVIIWFVIILKNKSEGEWI